MTSCYVCDGFHIFPLTFGSLTAFPAIFPVDIHRVATSVFAGVQEPPFGLNFRQKSAVYFNLRNHDFSRLGGGFETLVKFFSA